MAIAIVTTFCMMTPAAAAADRWLVGGVPYAGTARIMGTLTQTSSSGWTMTCSVIATASLNNPSGVAAGSIGSYLLGTAAGGTCTTNIPNCAVAPVAWIPPAWPISTSGTSVSISGVLLSYVYTGTGCALNGVASSSTGSMTGTISGATITFANSPGITTPFGPATISGSLSVATSLSGGSPVVLG